MQRRSHFWSALAGGLVAALAVTAFPAIAQDAETNATPGDPFLLGVTNVVDATTSLRGDSGDGNLVLRNTGSGVPLSLRNKAGGVPNGRPPMDVDSRRLVKNLNVDRVDFRHADELIRAEFGSTTDAPNANGDAVAATIQAPKPGYLIMSGSIDAIGSTNDLWDCRLTVNGALVVGSIRNVRVNAEGGDHTRNDEEDCATDGGIAVDTGTYDVALTIGNRNNANFDNAVVTVIWAAFDGVGAVPSTSAPDTTVEPVDRLDPRGESR